MASIEKRGQGCYVVRWRTPDGKSRTKTLKRDVDAKRFRTSIEHSKDVGAYLDPGRSKITVKLWAAQCIAAWAHLKPSTRDKRIPSNPATGVRLPRVAKPEKRFLTPEEVHRLADAAAQYPIPEIGPQYRALVLVLAFCGLRWGEAAALKVKRVDLLRRRLTVAESVTEVSGQLVWGTPKSHAARLVPIPRSLVDMLTEVMAGNGVDDLVFTTWRGKPLRNLNWRRDVFDKAAIDAGLESLTPHELRHTAASLAVSAGANVKAVQKMLGHSSAAMTLDVYSGLFDDDLDGVADRMDALPGVSNLRHDATVTELPSPVK